MQLVKLITRKRIKTLYCFSITLVLFVTGALSPVFSQDNSPYSRYGIGDLVPTTNIISRGMGGISAGYTDVFSINFNNPASYSFFQAGKELTSKKLVYGRAILDVGMNFENRTLREPNTAKSFKASNALFSHVQVGVPLKNNWGLSFGLRPVSRISYKINRYEKLVDPNTGNLIDSALTRYEGKGGAYLPSIGTGFSVFRKVKPNGEQKLSLGVNIGYLFGEKDYSTKRSLINDTVDYYQANYETKTNYGSLYFGGGIQFRTPVSKDIALTLGAYGNWGQNINASQDILRETFFFDINSGDVRLDSVSDQRNVQGKLRMPLNYTVGFQFQKFAVSTKESGWILGVDFTQQKWDEYRFYGQLDSVQNKWEVKVGGQFNPIPKRNYFSNVAYRAGVSFGPDYIKVGQPLNQVTASFGLGLPVALSRQAPNQLTIVNLAFEYIKRGNNTNLLKENMFRFSVGFSLSDYWFVKRRYD